MANLPGALGGAASGASLGTSIFPGIGTAIGGLLGGIGGLFSGGSSAPPNVGAEQLNNYVSSVDPAHQSENAGMFNPATADSYAKAEVAGNQPLQHALGQEQSQYDQQNGLYQGQGQRLDQLQNQGFQLTPEDQTLYGQESGNIARQFGQAGNQAANSLAQRGLSSSGAAGAQFSGLAGSQNEALSRAQQQIAQNRFQNTMSQIGQTQQFMSQLGQQNAGISNNIANQGQSAYNSQRQNNLAGAEGYTHALAYAANGGKSQLEGAKFNAEQNPSMGGMLAGAAGPFLGQAAGEAGKSLFGPSAPKAPDYTNADGFGGGIK